MPAKKKRVIVCLVTKRAAVYVIDREPIGQQWADRDGFKVEEIQAFRDGVTGLFKEGSDGAHYTVTLTNEITDKIKMYDVIPSREVAQISFAIEDQEPADKEQVELTTEE